MRAPALPDLEQKPAFAEPWQAQAFACALELARRGLFAWTEWTEALGAEVRAHPARPQETHNEAYYRQWLEALETLVRLKGAASAAELAERLESWRRAYLNTPHGQTVELSHARSAPAGKPACESGERARAPLTVSPARD